MIVLLYLLYGTRVSARRVYRRIHHTSANQLRIALEPFSELNSSFWSSSRGVGERSRAKTQVAGTRPGAPIIPHAAPPLLKPSRAVRTIGCPRLECAFWAGRAICKIGGVRHHALGIYFERWL